MKALKICAIGVGLLLGSAVIALPNLNIVHAQIYTAEDRAEIREMRQLYLAREKAIKDNDKDAFIKASQEIQASYKKLSPSAQNHVKVQRPDFHSKVTNRSFTAVTTFEREGSTRYGHTVVTNKQGEVVRTIEGQTTREDGVKTHSHTVYNNEGEQIRTNDTTWTKEGNTVTRDTDITRRDGSTKEVDAVHVRDGNTVTTTKNVEGSKGKSMTLEATTTKDGNTASREGTWTNNNNGKTADVTGTRTRTEDGRVVTHNKVTGKNGKTLRQRHTVKQKNEDGNVVRRSVVGQRGKGIRGTQTTRNRDGASTTREVKQRSLRTNASNKTGKARSAGRRR